MRTSSTVQSLCALFFDVHLRRVNAIEPYRSTKSLARPLDTQAMIPEPEVIRYDIVKCGEASWFEEQRVLRALWRIALTLDIAAALEEEQGGSDMAGALLEAGPRVCWEKDEWGMNAQSPDGLRAHEKQEVDCVYEFRKENAGIGSHARHLPTNNVPMSYGALKEEWQSGEGRRSCHESLDMPNAVFSVCHSQTARYGGFFGKSFTPLRRLGLRIWDREKIGRRGLLEPSALGEEALPSGFLVRIPSWPDLLIRSKSLSVKEGNGAKT